MWSITTLLLSLIQCFILQKSIQLQHFIQLYVTGRPVQVLAWSLNSDFSVNIRSIMILLNYTDEKYFQVST